jgi:hypothetical protein
VTVCLQNYRFYTAALCVLPPLPMGPTARQRHWCSDRLQAAAVEGGACSVCVIVCCAAGPPCMAVRHAWLHQAVVLALSESAQLPPPGCHRLMLHTGATCP